MSNISAISYFHESKAGPTDPALAASITRSASRQTYYTIRFLVDRDRVQDAYRAYAYFRWLDDRLDQDGLEKAERLVFVERQRALVERCYRGDPLAALTEQEALLAELIRSDHEPNSGLQAYIRDMMAVMAFDAGRRGRLISAQELDQYTHSLSASVMEALHYFIGHGSRAPQGKTRYLAVTAAHIAHMLRDTLEDIQAGYFNIPREYVNAHGIDPHQVHSDVYRDWIRSRVQLARACFNSGREYLSRVENPRTRIACHAYIARFEGVLDAIEADDYHLRSGYPEGKSPAAAIGTVWSALARSFTYRGAEDVPNVLPID